MVLHFVVVLLASHAALVFGDGLGISQLTVMLSGTQRTVASQSCDQCYRLNREQARFVLLEAHRGSRRRPIQGEKSVGWQTTRSARP